MKLSQALGLISLVGLAAADTPLPSSPAATITCRPKVGLNSGQAKLLDKCCQVGKERAIESMKSDCKLSALEALAGRSPATRPIGVASSFEAQLNRDPNLVEQCELIMESCCIGQHRNRNCDSGKQFAKSGATCMDVELSKDVTVAAESFNDCCMSCSLGILAARNPPGPEQNRSSLEARCKLLSPLASSLPGQLYEQTYSECCHENLPRPSGALLEPGAPIDCDQANPCAHRCLPAGSREPNTYRQLERDRCDCFSGYKLASDGVSCSDIDECKLGLHTCNKQSEVCDNTRGSFRCLARRGQMARAFIFESPQQDSLGPRLTSTQNGNERLAISTGGQQDQFASLQSSAEYISLRLCPLGSHWNSEKNQCQ